MRENQSQPCRVIDCLVESIRDAGVYNPDAQVAPACILWTDGDRQWEPVLPRLQREMPELFRLGDFDLAERQGPAIWLRVVIAGKWQPPDPPDPGDRIPVLYLPGVSRQELRAVESCPEHLKPLAELQYRGVIWSQANAKDWTVLALLKSTQGGLGLDVAQDRETRHAMQLALYAVLDEELERLQEKHLDKDYFNTLLAGGDPIRDLLQWLNQGETFKAARDENAWRGFVEVSKSQLGFDPDQDGPFKGAEYLAGHKGPWQAVWDRFCEAPQRYATIPSLISKTPLPRDLFTDKTGWPKWNQNEEQKLRHQLLQTAELPGHEARKLLAAAEQQHAARRDCVWAQLGEAPLAQAVEHLATLAEATGQSLAAGEPKDMAAAYQTGAWRADAAVVGALAAVHKPDDIKAVETAIRAVYLSWIDNAARYLQKQVAPAAYPGARVQEHKPSHGAAGHCILFVDGLRFDLAKSLEAMLDGKGCKHRAGPIRPFPSACGFRRLARAASASFVATPARPAKRRAGVPILRQGRIGGCRFRLGSQ